MNNKTRFEVYILDIVQRKFTDSAECKLITEKVLEILSKSSTRLDGQIFYDILKFLNLDIDNICEQYFQDKNSKVLNSLTASSNLFRDLISPYVNSQNQLSDSSDIKGKRFNRLFSGELSELYAHEVYDLSIALNAKPHILFEYFYGNGDRPIIGLVPPAEEKKGK